MTSSISSLAVPTDIPWRRICVTGDMLDPEPCDLIVPPRWRSSIAVFRHDPPDEFQPLPRSRLNASLSVRLRLTAARPARLISSL